MDYRWYAVQTTAGHENKVRMLLQKRIEEDPRPAEQKLVRQALVPVQEAIEIKNGKKVVVERKLYPGYVLIETTMHRRARKQGAAAPRKADRGRPAGGRPEAGPPGPGPGPGGDRDQERQEGRGGAA